MKILHIIPHLRKGGAERLVIDLMKALAAIEGIDARLVLLYDALDNDVSEIKHLIHVIPSKVTLSVYRKNQLDISALQSFIEDFQPDIIHSHLYEAELISRSCYYPKAKWFSHAHGFFPEFMPFSSSTLFNKKNLFRFYDGYYLLRRYKANGNNTYLAVSEAIRQFISQRFGGPCILLYNAINNSFFKAPKTTVGHNGTLRLISVGRFDENKNQTFLIDVIGKLVELNFPVHLSLFGDGTTKPEIEQKIQSLGLEKHVSLCGIVNNIEEQYEHFDMYVHAAKKEAFGLTLVEAMAAGLPVISLDGGGNKELIQNGINGIMLQTENPLIFASEITKLWNDPTAYAEMSQHAFSYAQNFRFDAYVDKLLSIYSQALSGA